jgi:RNA recognition motif-containing protein
LQGGMGFGAGRVKADKDGGPSEILWVGFPLPSKVDEDGLRRAFMPYGEVERVKTFPGRTYAFVQFQKVEEATRAKNALDGKLFDDPRVHIRYSKSEIGPIDSPRDGPPPSSQRLGDRQGFSSEVIGGPRGMPPAGGDRFGSPGRPSTNPNSRLGGGLRPEYRPNALLAGLADRGSSREPDGGPPGMGRRNLNHLDDMEYSRGIRPDSRSSYDDTWDLPDADIVPRDSKRLRVYPGGGADSPGFDPWYEQRQQQGSDSAAYGTSGPNNYEPLRVPATTDYSLGLGGRPRAGLPGTDNNSLPIGTRSAGSGHAPASNSSVTSMTSPYSKHAVEDVKGPEGWQWHGTIAKGGTPVCRARCLPVGKGIDATV